MKIPEIETQRLLLRRFRLDDLDQLSPIFLDPNVVQYLGDGETASREDAEKYLKNYIKNYWEEHGFGIWAVLHKADQKVIGYCGLRVLEGKPELVYLLAKPYWGMGLATEAARACARFGLEVLQLEQIVAVAKPDNLASRRVLERIGFNFERVGRLYHWDCVYYAISRASFNSNNSHYSLRFNEE